MNNLWELLTVLHFRKFFEKICDNIEIFEIWVFLTVCLEYILDLSNVCDILLRIFDAFGEFLTIVWSIFDDLWEFANFEILWMFAKFYWGFLLPNFKNLWSIFGNCRWFLCISESSLIVLWELASVLKFFECLWNLVEYLWLMLTILGIVDHVFVFWKVLW